MKVFIAAIAAASLSLTVTQAQAGSYRRYTSSTCAPYRVSTYEVGRCSYCKTAYNHCGVRYHYTVTVVTYRDYYSDGSRQTHTRTFRS